MATMTKKKRSGQTDAVVEESSAEKHYQCRTNEQQEKATEKEVEEFFTILRRIRESAARRGVSVRRRLGSADEMPEGRTVPAWRWRPSFELEDFGQPTTSRHVEDDSGSGKKRRTPPSDEEDDEEDGLRRGFDLNMEPSASEDSPAVASSRWRERKRD